MNWGYASPWPRVHIALESHPVSAWNAHQTSRLMKRTNLNIDAQNLVAGLLALPCSFSMLIYRLGDHLCKVLGTKLTFFSILNIPAMHVVSFTVSAPTCYVQTCSLLVTAK